MIIVDSCANMVKFHCNVNRCVCYYSCIFRLLKTWKKRPKTMTTSVAGGDFDRRSYELSYRGDHCAQKAAGSPAFANSNVGCRLITL